MTQNIHTLLPSSLQGIIFDCDGVILNSRSANACYYNKVLEALHLPPLTAQQESFTYMSTVQQALEHIIPQELHAKAREIQGNIVDYQRDIMPLVSLEEGLMDFLAWAQTQHIRMAVHTNRHNGMPFIMEKFQLHGYFDHIMTAADVCPKPSPEGVHRILELWNMPQNAVIFIGDSQNDAQTAKNAHVSFVAYGNESIDAAIKTKNFKDLQNILSKAF